LNDLNPKKSKFSVIKENISFITDSILDEFLINFSKEKFIRMIKQNQKYLRINQFYLRTSFIEFG
jgi:hypothetical protein